MGRIVRAIRFRIAAWIAPEAEAVVDVKLVVDSDQVCAEVDRVCRELDRELRRQRRAIAEPNVDDSALE